MPHLLVRSIDASIIDPAYLAKTFRSVLVLLDGVTDDFQLTEVSLNAPSGIEFGILNVACVPHPTVGDKVKGAVFGGTPTHTLEFSILNSLLKSAIFPDPSNFTVAMAIATVKLEGSGNMADFKREFKIENSNVWVGVPPKTAPLTLSPTVGCGTQATFRIPNSMPEGAFNETSVNWKSSVTPSSKTKTDLKVFAKYAGSIIDASMDLTNKCGTSRSNTATIVVTGNCGTIDPERPGKPGQPGLDPELRAKNNSRLNSYLPITSVKVYVYPTGSLVYQKKNVVNFDIQNTTLGEGIYILEITDQEGNVTREKVMKSKQ